MPGRLVASTVVNSEQKPGAIVLRVQGRLQLDRLASLQTELERAWPAKPAKLIVDFTGCPFVDTAGIAVLVGAHKHACEDKVGFFLTGLSEQLLSVLRMTRLNTVFTIRDTVEAALAA